MERKLIIYGIGVVLLLGVAQGVAQATDCIVVISTYWVSRTLDWVTIGGAVAVAATAPVVSVLAIADALTGRHRAMEYVQALGRRSRMLTRPLVIAWRAIRRQPSTVGVPPKPTTDQSWKRTIINVTPINQRQGSGRGPHQ